MFFEQTLRRKLETYYNLEDNFFIAGKDFNFIARYNQRNSKYILHKKIELYAFENNEYILYKKLDKGFAEETLNEIKNLINNHYSQIIDVNDEHMSSTIIFIFETDLPTNKKLINSIKKFNFYKSFKFGLKGWINVGLVLINPDNKEGLSNKYAKKELKKILS